MGHDSSALSLRPFVTTGSTTRGGLLWTAVGFAGSTLFGSFACSALPFFFLAPASASLYFSKSYSATSFAGAMRATSRTPSKRTPTRP
eukprot:6615471-Prymnesium_polylepis.1